MGGFDIDRGVWVLLKASDAPDPAALRAGDVRRDQRGWWAYQRGVVSAMPAYGPPDVACRGSYRLTQSRRTCGLRGTVMVGVFRGSHRPDYDFLCAECAQADWQDGGPSFMYVAAVWDWPSWRWCTPAGEDDVTVAGEPIQPPASASEPLEVRSWDYPWSADPPQF